MSIGNKTIARFWGKVNKDGPVPAHAKHLGKCWLWNGYHFGNGYARIYVKRLGKRHNEYAHRLSMEIATGKHPGPSYVLHKCDNPGCVNPRHLFLGTQRQNLLDCSKKGRHARHGMIGSDHPAAILTESKVREMRRRHAAGETRQELRVAFGVSLAAVHDVLGGRSWKHVK